MTAETLLAAVLLLFAPRGDDAHPAGDKLKDREQLLAQLYELQRRVRAGELPSETEMAPGRVTRQRVLAGLDVRKAKHLGVDPKAIRDLLVPGFSQELDQLLRRQEAHELAPGEDPSPLLTLLLDVEQRMFIAADRKRQRAGIKSPIDSGPLSRKLEAPAPASAAPADGASEAAPAKGVASVPVDVALRGADPRAVGRALYRAGRYPDALKAWERVDFDDPKTELELQYMHADALFRSGRQESALKEWEHLASAHADTSYGQQAAFARDMARAVMAVRAARGDDVKPVESASNGGAGEPARPAPDEKAEKREPKPDAGGHKDDAPRHGGGTAS